MRQLDSVQQQLVFVSGQRDAAYVQLSTLQEQNDLLNTSITNLQMVLEQFQQGIMSTVELALFITSQTKFVMGGCVT